NVPIVRQRIRGPNELRPGRPRVIHPLVRFRQLQARLAEFRIEPHRVGIFDDGELVALFRGVLVAAFEVALFLGFRAAAGQRPKQDHKQEDDASIGEKLERHWSRTLVPVCLTREQAIALSVTASSRSSIGNPPAPTDASGGYIRMGAIDFEASLRDWVLNL